MGARARKTSSGFGSGGVGSSAGADGAGEGGSASLRLLQSHGEQVLRMPAGSLLLGCSSTARHELFVCGRHRNASLQNARMRPMQQCCQLRPALPYYT